MTFSTFQLEVTLKMILMAFRHTSMSALLNKVIYRLCKNARGGDKPWGYFR
jgi:hypothetical protein